MVPFREKIDKAVDFLLSCDNNAYAAHKSFVKEMDKNTDAKQTILTEACDALSARLTLAVDTLCDIIEDKETSNTIKVSASDALLRHGLRYVEAVNIVKRIEALEAITEEE